MLLSGGQHYTSMTVYHDPFQRAFTFGCIKEGSLEADPLLRSRFHVQVDDTFDRMALFSGVEGDLLMNGGHQCFLFMVPRPGHQLSFLEAFVPSGDSHVVVMPNKWNGLYCITPGTIVVCLKDGARQQAIKMADAALKEDRTCYDEEKADDVFVCVNVFLRIDERNSLHQAIMRDIGHFSTYAMQVHRKLIPKLLHDVGMACASNSDYKDMRLRNSKLDPKVRVTDDIIFDDLRLPQPDVGICYLKDSAVHGPMGCYVLASAPFCGWPTLGANRMRVPAFQRPAEKRAAPDGDRPQEAKKVCG